VTRPQKTTTSFGQRTKSTKNLEKAKAILKEKDKMEKINTLPIWKKSLDVLTKNKSKFKKN